MALCFCVLNVLAIDSEAIQLLPERIDGGATLLKHARNSKKNHQKNIGDYGDVSHSGDLVLLPCLRTRMLFPKSMTTTTTTTPASVTSMPGSTTGNPSWSICSSVAMRTDMPDTTIPAAVRSHYHHFDTTLSRDELLLLYRKSDSGRLLRTKDYGSYVQHTTHWTYS